MHDESETKVCCNSVAEFDHLSEFVGRIDVQEWERGLDWKKRLLRQPEHHRRVFTDRIKHNRAREFGHHLTQDVDAFRFQCFKMRQDAGSQNSTSNRKGSGTHGRMPRTLEEIGEVSLADTPRYFLRLLCLPQMLQRACIPDQRNDGLHGLRARVIDGLRAKFFDNLYHLDAPNARESRHGAQRIQGFNVNKSNTLEAAYTVATGKPASFSQTGQLLVRRDCGDRGSSTSCTSGSLIAELQPDDRQTERKSKPQLAVRDFRR